jgi:hypothetical protein
MSAPILLPHHPETGRNRSKNKVAADKTELLTATYVAREIRVTGHGRVVLITHRSLIQIQPPQPIQGLGRSTLPGP